MLGQRAIVVSSNYLETAPEKPNDKEEMKPLFEAMFHGCNAGKYDELLSEVLQARILQCDPKRTLVLSAPTPLDFGVKPWKLSGSSSEILGSWCVMNLADDKAFLFTSAALVSGHCFVSPKRSKQSIEGLRLRLESQE